MFEKLFDNSNQFLLKESLSYKDFYKLCLENAHTISNTADTVSLSVSNDTTDLINIFSLFILGKSIVLYSDKEPIENILKRNKLLNATELRKNNNQFNNTLNTSFDLDSIAIYIFTSGSSSEPKAIPLTFNNLICAATNFNNFYKVEESHYLPATLPLYHVGGLLVLIRTLMAQASTDLVSPSELSIENFTRSPDFLSVVPTQLNRLIDSDNISQFKKTKFILGGAKVQNSLIDKIVKAKLSVSCTYGMTETTAMCLATPLGHEKETLQTVGKPLGDTKLLLNESGILSIQSSCVSPIFKNSKIDTFDMASIDSSGNYTILGRSDHIFISGGENINPAEIENTLSTLSSAESILVSIEDKDLQNIGILFHEELISKNEISSLCRKSLHPFKVPKKYYPLLKSNKGIKTSRAMLKKIAQQYQKIEKLNSPIPFECFGDPDKEWLIFLHGFMGEKKDWRQVAKSLQDDFFIITLDCPGHGEYFIEDIKSIDYYTELYIRFINQLDKKVHLIGYSQGARLALGIALKNVKIKSLTLESGSVGIADEDQRALRYKSDLQLFSRIQSKNDLINFFEYWYSNSLFGNFNQLENYKNIILEKVKYDHAQWQLSLKALSVGNQENYRPKLKNLEIPRLTICGQKDHKYFAQSKELQTSYGFELISVTGVSHNTHVESLDQFCAAIKTFINTVR